MRAIAAIGLLMIACSTTPAPDENTGTADVVTTGVGPRETIDLLRENTLFTQEYAATRDEVVRALLAAEDDIGIPVESVDAGTGTVVYYIRANTPQIAGRSASAWIDCGRGAGGTPRASTYRITLRMTGIVEEVDARRSRARIMIVATARDRGMSADEVQCRTNGRLEQRVLGLISTELAT